MNERIKELATQAWKEVLSETSIDGDTSNVYSPDEVVAFEQKFAELIVKDCATICVKVSDTTRIDDTTHEGDVCSYKIKQHFGVEE